MKQIKMTVLSNTSVGHDTFEMILTGDTILRSGQFIELQLPNKYLRRPFSVARYKDNTLTLLYKVLGAGTSDMTEVGFGTVFDVLSELGNTFDISNVTSPLLIGGGIGIAPLFNLANDFAEKGITANVILGFRNKDEMFYVEEFKKIANVTIATDDGSFGFVGNVVDCLKRSNIAYDKYFACGPMVMLKGLASHSDMGELSLEARMGCGFGACMGCTIQTTKGYARVCKEGPVFKASEVIF